MNRADIPQDPVEQPPATPRLSEAVATVGSSDGASRVAIIGGGLAGMAAAHALAASPLQVSLYEARRRTGGRAGSFFEPLQQRGVDYCQHVAMRCCTSFWHLMERSGLSDQFDRVRELTFLAADGSESQFSATACLPAPFHFVPAFCRLRFLTPRDRVEIRRGIWRLMRTVAADVPADRSFGDWLRAQSQSQDTMERFWNVVIASALGEDLDRVAFAPARKVFVEGFLSAREAYQILIPRLPLSHLFGECLPAALKTAGVTVEAATPVTRLNLKAGRMAGLQMKDGRVLPADKVIIAVPWHTAGRLLPASVQAIGPSPNSASPAFEDLSVSPITGVHLWFDRPITDRKHAVLIGGLGQWLFQPSFQTKAARPPATDDERAADRPSDHYYQIVVSASRQVRQQGSEATVEQIRQELNTYFPAARRATLRHWRMVTDPQAVFSVSPDSETRRPQQTTSHPDIFLAGDYTATGWPATMEGAVISGYRAADAVLRSLDLGTVPCPAPLKQNWLVRRLIR